MKLLITRPKNSAQQLAEFLATQAIDSVCWPAVEIVPPEDTASVAAVVQPDFIADHSIFVSPNAVDALFNWHQGQAIEFSLPVYAIGQGTAERLAQYGITEVIFPEQANSQGLLALEELQQLDGQSVVIFAGVDGNTLLYESLQAEGAVVHMAYTHQRQFPAGQLPSDWQVADITVSMVSSLAVLENFARLIEQQQQQALYQKPLIVITETMRQSAINLGFAGEIILAQGAGNTQILQALTEHF